MGVGHVFVEVPQWRSSLHVLYMRERKRLGEGGCVLLQKYLMEESSLHGVCMRGEGEIEVGREGLYVFA